MEKILIGNVGFDVISCTGFAFEEEQLLALKQRISMGETFGSGEVRISSKDYLMIKEDNLFEFMSFTSNLTGERYSKMTLHAARVDGNNICNMTVTTVKEKMDVATQILSTKYGLTVKCYDTKISRCEINKTIVTRDAFEAYKRLLRIVALIMSKGTGKVNTITTEELKRTLKEQGILCQKKSYAWRIYDKAADMFEKHGGITFDKHLMRVEKVYISGQAFETDFGSTSLEKMTDEKLESVFSEKMRDIEKGVKSYLEDKMQYRPGYIGRDITVPNIIERYRNCGKVMSVLMAYENHYYIPCILDARDIKIAFQNLSKNGIMPDTAIESSYEQYMNHYKIIPELVTVWDEQRELMEEFFAKLTDEYLEQVKMRN